MSIPDVRRLLRAHAVKTAGKHAVMRAVVGHDDWHVPASYAASALGRTQLARLVILGDTVSAQPGVLVIYSDLETATVAQAALGSLGPLEGGISGIELFARLDPAIETIVINEGAEAYDKAYFAGPAFENAPVWADVLQLERGLEGDAAAAVAAFRRYDAFFIALHPNRQIVTLANYPGLANAMMLFSAPDCLAAFQAEAGDATIEPVQTTGEQILSMLPEVAGYDGVVVNAFGPGTQRALTVAELLG